VDKDLASERVRDYQGSSRPSDQKPLSQFYCNFDKFSQPSVGGETGVFCRDNLYYYSLPQDSQEKARLFDRTFEVKGQEAATVSYLFNMQVASDFLTAGGLQIRLEKESSDVLSDGGVYDCLADNSCAVAERNSKNTLSFSLVLTSGKYRIVFSDVQNSDVRNKLRNQIGVQEVPISVNVNAVPIIQNEDRYVLFPLVWF